jgi:hypothetical protein
MANNESKKKSADPLPYIIVFAILFLVALGVLTWTLGIWYKAQQCVLNPNIWCSDNWTCNTNCPTGYTGNACFLNAATGSTGLASCLFGPNAPGATVCLNTPSGTGGLSCDCPTGMASQTNNCFAGCSQNLGSVASESTCCCKPGMAGCKNTSIPTICGATS